MGSSFLMLLRPVILLLSSKTSAQPLMELTSASCLLKKLIYATCSEESLLLYYTVKG